MIISPKHPVYFLKFLEKQYFYKSLSIKKLHTGKKSIMKLLDIFLIAEKQYLLLGITVLFLSQNYTFEKYFGSKQAKKI